MFKIAPTLTTGLDGASSTTSAVSMDFDDAGAGGRLVGADEREAVGRYLRAVAHPPLLEVDRPLLAVARDR